MKNRRKTNYDEMIFDEYPISDMLTTFRAFGLNVRYIPEKRVFTFSDLTCVAWKVRDEVKVKKMPDRATLIKRSIGSGYTNGASRVYDHMISKSAAESWQKSLMSTYEYDSGLIWDIQISDGTWTGVSKERAYELYSNLKGTFSSQDDELGSSYSFDLLESQVKTFNEFNERLAEQSDDIGRDIDLLKTFDVSVTHNTKNGEKFDIFNLVKLLFYKQRLNERELKELTDPNVPSLLRINGSAYLIYYIIPTELKHFNQTILNKVGFNLNSDSILRNNDFTEIVGEWLAFSYLTAMDGSKIRLMASRLRNQLGIDGSDMEDGIKDQAQLM